MKQVLALNGLTDLVPARYRKVVHSVLTLALAIVSLWLAYQGDWEAFLTALAAGYTASNASNTFESPPENGFEEFDINDEHVAGLSEFEYVEEREQD